jgi:phosphoribosylamine--glycine ligase
VKVCVVGAGAREHALADTLGRSAEVVVTPGNPGIPNSVPERPDDADLYVIGPEVPLVDGLADELRAAGKRVFGPGADGAQLEGSKAWMKQLLVDAGVASARHGSFTSEQPALAYLDTMTPPYVVKTDGLAAGKGVIVTDSLTEARNAVGDYLSGSVLGGAGRRLVIEEGLDGPELSVFAVCDGRRAVAFSPAQDFKRVGDGDAGANTGGMGAYSPSADDDLVGDVMDRFVEPTLATLARRGIDYRGVLYAGLMLTAAGPKMLEYNVRFGDPECQVVVPRLTSDLTELLAQAADGHLTDQPTFSSDVMVNVVCAAEGYPDAPRTGDLITGIDAANAIDGVMVFCAGVGPGMITAGGRVLSVTGRAATLVEARARAYAGVAAISWPGMHHRTDIAAAATRPAK